MNARSPKSKATSIGELLHSITRRDPSKRQIKPVNTANLLLDDLDDESDDEYVYDGEDADDSSSGSGELDGSNESSSETTDETSEVEEEVDEDTTNVPHEAAEKKEVDRLPDLHNTNTISKDICIPSVSSVAREKTTPKLPELICMLCLGDQSNPNDEIIECDACKIAVHEDCHKVYDDVFLSSSASSSDTDPWFCEPCLAGVENPHCELCPNLGGIFKRTDNNRWVHLLCALYTPGVAFNYSESLTEVTLTELPAKEWSSRECCLCEDKFFAWTGVCISCDAGLCKNYFHVTCAQKQGLLVEPAFEENPSDPFFAQCRQHTDKTVAKGRRRNYLTTVNRCKVLLQMAQKQYKGNVYDNTEEFGASTTEMSLFTLLNERLKRKLEYFRSLYQRMLDRREKPYTRPTKVPLYLENSPVAMRLFAAKALALGLPLDYTGSSAMTEASKSVAPGCPVFLPDFVSYVLDREKRIEELVKTLSKLESTQRELQLSDANVSHNYNSLSTRLAELSAKLKANRSAAEGFVNGLSKICPNVSPAGGLCTLLANQEPPSSVSSGVTGSNSAGGTAAGPKSTGDASVGVRGRGRRSATRQFPPASSRSSSGPLRRRTRASESSMDAGGEGPESVPGVTNAAAENIIHECSVCSGLRDQHLMVICETCKKAFHIACLDPPLSRVPKQSRLFSWQCSTCTKAVVANSEVVTVDVDAPRQLRHTSAPAPPQPIPHSSPSNPTPTASKPGRRGRKPKTVTDPSSPCTTTPELSNPSGDQPVVMTGKACNRSRPLATASAASKPGRRPRKRPRKPPVRRVVAEAYPAEIVPSVDPADGSVLPVLASPSFSAVVNHNGGAPESISPPEPIFLGSASAVITSTNQEASIPTAVSPADQMVKKRRAPSETSEQSVSENEDDQDEAEEEEDSEEDEEEEDDGEDEDDEVEENSNEEIEDDDSDGLSNLRSSKVKFVQIRGHESPVKETPSETDAAEPARQCYVICQDNCSTRKKSPTVSNFKMKIRKVE